MTPLPAALPDDPAAAAALLDPAAVLRALPAQLRDAAGADLAAVGVREREGAVVLRHLVGARGDALAGLEVAAGRGVGGRALALGRPVRVDDYARDGSITRDYDLPVRAEGLRTVVALPLVVAGSVLAVAYAGWRGPAGADVPGARLADVARAAAARLHLAGVAAAQREVALQEQRRHLAGALHDAVGGPLFGVAAQVADLLAGPAPDPRLQRLDARVREASAALRALLDDLSRAGTATAGELAVEVAADCRALAARSDLDARAVVAPGLPALDPAGTTALVAAGREALRNAERHARARSVVATLAPVDGGVLLVVTDDGCGPGAGERRGGLGLPAARARLERLGGRLEVLDADPGTAVRAWLPAS